MRIRYFQFQATCGACFQFWLTRLLLVELMSNYCLFFWKPKEKGTSEVNRTFVNHKLQRRETIVKNTQNTYAKMHSSRYKAFTDGI